MERNNDAFIKPLSLSPENEMEQNQRHMNDSQTTPVTGVMGTVATLGFWILSHYALTNIAAIVAIVTGITTIAVNIQRFFINKKNNPNGNNH